MSRSKLERIRKRSFSVVVLGGSAGSIEVITSVLPRIRPSISLPIVCVIHLSPNAKSLLPQLISSRAQIPAKEAEPTEELLAGRIYFAPPDYHLSLEANKRFSLSTEAPVNFSRPSIDILFESAALALGPGVLGILLTGANSDGALGLKRIADLGGITVVEDPKTAKYPTMPESALRLFMPDLTLSQDQIGELLARLE